MSLRLIVSTSALVAVASFLGGCGGASSDGLFSPPGAAAQTSVGGGHHAPWENGGASFGGSGGAGFGSGGSPFGSGGQGSGGGLGGTPSSGGDTGSGGNPSGCNFTGTWASYIQAPVTWPASIAIDAGQGNLQQWNLSKQTMNGNDVTAVTVPCGIFLPDLQSSLLGSKFGIRFPDQLFDDGAVPETTFILRGRQEGTTFAFDTDPFAIVLGTVLPRPVTDPWPAPTALMLVDHDLDTKPGITVVPAPGGGYSFPPTDLAGGRADLIYIAERTVSSLSGVVVSCDEVRSDVTIAQNGINSTVVGCRKSDSVTNCIASDATFIDTNRPIFQPSALGKMTTVRLPDGAGCKEVRGHFPKQ